MKKTKIIGAIIGVTLFATVIIGLTYAFATWSSQSMNKQVSSKCFNVLYDKGSDIIGPITPSYDYTGGLSTTIRMNMSTRCDVNAKGILYLNTYSGTSENLFREGLLNYHVVRNGNTVIASGTITESGQIAIDIGSIAHSQTAFTRYEVYVWINYNLIENSDVNSVYYGSIKAVAVQDEGEYTPPTTTLIDHITDLYLNNNPEQITQYGEDGTTEVAKYYYSYIDTEKTWGIMNDGLGATVNDTDALINGTQGNLRYYGSTPNNYIYFNCDNYSNQTDNTCERWRIIGIVDGKVKIMRNEKLGYYSWDYTSTGEYDNNWHDSTLQVLLNDGYYNNLDDVSYYNGSAVPITINFKTDKKGIKNDKTREMISESTWYLGGHSTSYIYVNDIYGYERGDSIGANINKTWTGNIGLMYPSDAGYASDLSICNQMLANYETSICWDSNWLYSIGGSKILITPNDFANLHVWRVRAQNQIIGDVNANANTTGVYTTLYLEPELILDDLGDGSYEEPYQILDF